jgi:RNA polymerase sigma factor (TIGR02999 family)
MYNSTMSDVTRMLSAIERGDPAAAESLLPLVYGELRRLAAAKLSHEKPGQTLQLTVLVHEAYLRLVDREQPQVWNGRGHFFAAAAEAMRRILVENARRRQSQKRGGEWRRVEFDAAAFASTGSSEDLLALDEVLTQLEARWPDKARLVKLRYFAGLTMPEAAQAMRISVATAERHWTFARAWLHAQLSDRDSTEAPKNS